ncbi:MAG: hypothetical protein LBK65_00375, partial [Tannerellaceae bacterium]|nr:hypothetical protein [Tannerellaceae bacterium]
PSSGSPALLQADVAMMVATRKKPRCFILNNFKLRDKATVQQRFTLTKTIPEVHLHRAAFNPIFHPFRHQIGTNIHHISLCIFSPSPATLTVCFGPVF